jgi:hypothetical protein
MLRTLGLGMLYFASFLSTSAYSIESHFLQQGLSIQYDLPSNDPQTFINSMFWAIEATCKITTEDESDEFSVIALAKKGRINDIPLSKGDTVQITVHPDDFLKVGADSGAKVKITNYGLHTVRAICTA